MEIAAQIMGIFLIVCFLFCNLDSLCNATNNNKEVNIRVILDYDSWVQKVAKTAIQIAMDYVNRDTHLLHGSSIGSSLATFSPLEQLCHCDLLFQSQFQFVLHPFYLAWKKLMKSSFQNCM